MANNKPANQGAKPANTGDTGKLPKRTPATITREKKPTGGTK
jgi:hypothetical protein